MRLMRHITTQIRLVFGSLVLHLTAPRNCDLAGVARCMACPHDCPVYKVCMIRRFGVQFEPTA